MSEGVFKDISCPLCNNKTFRAIYLFIHNAIGLMTLQCTSCLKEIDIIPYDNEGIGIEHETALEVEYHETEEREQ